MGLLKFLINLAKYRQRKWADNRKNNRYNIKIVKLRLPSQCDK